MNYEQIKTLAKQVKRPVTELIALAPQNDPFYVGGPAQREKAEWFAGLFSEYGFTENVHIRRVHYRIISQRTPVLMPNGLPYENTDECWKVLEAASKYARYLDLVDSAAFVDRRNPEPIIYAEWFDYDPFIEVNMPFDGSSVELPAFPALPDYSVYNFAANQRYHIEIWCEKSTMNDVLQPICERHHCNLVTGIGEMSATALRNLVAQRLHAEHPARIFYISDFDPGGQSMPTAASRKCEFYVDKLGFGGNVKFYPIVMTAEQVKHYRLPRTPIKATERRAAKFEDRYGEGAVELDALEALYPGELSKIVRSEVRRYRDSTLSGRVFDEQSRLLNDLEDVQESVHDAHGQAIDALRTEYEQIAAEFRERVTDLNRRVFSVWQAIGNDLVDARPDMGDYIIPNALPADEKLHPLYDSNRDYLSQMASYKSFQGK